MARTTSTITASKEEALALYRKELFFNKSSPPLAEILPDAAEINSWRTATIAEIERRLNEIAFSPETSFTIDMFYDRPKDMVDFYNRFSGNEKDAWEE